jgi:hypothetical protein
MTLSRDRQRLLLRLRKLLAKALSFARRKPVRVVVLVILLLILTQVVNVFLKTHKYFGKGPELIGGVYGRRFDRTVKRAIFRNTVYQHRKDFQKIMGYELPETAESSANTVGTPVLTQTWLAETLIRAKQRSRIQEQAAADAEKEQERMCPSQQPRLLLANVGNWYRPLWPLKNRTDFRSVIFDELEMEYWMQTHFDWLYDDDLFQNLSQSQQVQMWGVCAVYRLGGIFASASTSLPELDEYARTMSTSVNCTIGTAQLWFQSELDGNNNDDDNGDKTAIRYLAATPRHGHLHCLLQEIKFRIESGQRPAWLDIFHLLEHSHWNEDEQCAPRCCPAPAILNSRQGVFLEPYRNVPTTRDDNTVQVPIDNNRFTVDIRQAAGTRPTVPSTKEPWGVRLLEMDCFAGWLCNRCLHLPWLGSFPSCRSVCNSCHEQHLCGEPVHQQQQVVVEVSVRERKDSGEKRIPRIIHQTWFEELTPERYPHLQRLQNSWKASGWDYRFYTDATARVFIQENYPDRFVEAYDAILAGAFKADLFRLLVLLKEGGIYADIDVQLDVNLDSFLTPNLSFFVPRDVAIDHWPRANYCLWNGLLGAAPGHPIIARAVEDLLNRILNRQDYYDMEGSVCSQNPDSEIWKLRSFPILLVTGPCALGISVNGALGRDNLVQGFDLGWLPEGRFPDDDHDDASLSDSSWGDALILLADKFDMGELRFTDINRNLLIASSNQDFFTRTPLSQSETELIKTPNHYSQYTQSEIVGEFGTYSDNQVANERIRLQVIHTVA